MMHPVEAFFLGMFVGAVSLWLIQLYARRKVRSALRGTTEGDLARENGRLTREMEDLHARMAVLEELATDPAMRTARQIEQLR